MNKRQQKKKLKYVIDNIQKFSLLENEILLFRIDTNKYNHKTVCDFADNIRKQITNKFVFTPMDWDIRKVTEHKSPATDVVQTQ